MANIKSKMKRVKTNEVRRQRNQKTKSEVKTLIKKVEELSGAEKVDEKALNEAIQAAQRGIDKASSKGRIHKKTASRKIGKLLKKATAPKAEAKPAEKATAKKAPAKATAKKPAAKKTTAAKKPAAKN